MSYYCFICDTPYHLLNCINLYFYLKTEDSKADIFIGDSFRDHDKMSGSLREIGLFDDVINFRTPHYYKNRIDWIQSKFEELFLEKKYLIKRTDGAIDFKRKYTDIFFAYNNAFSCIMRQLYSSSYMHFYEDGTSTYLGYSLVFSRFRKLLYKIIKKPLHIYDSYDIWVNNRDLYFSFHPEEKMVIRQLPPLLYNNFEFNNILSKVFLKTLDSSYIDNHIIFLTQPYDFITKINEHNIKKFYDIESKLMAELISMKSDVVVRIHPRETYIENYKGFKIDIGHNIWEIVAAKEIQNDHILISWCSTAQLVPKLFYDKEPYLVFTFPLLKDSLSKKRIQEIEKLIRLTTDLYNNKNKIILLEDWGDLSRVLYKIKNKL